MALWGGRFSAQMDGAAWSFNASISFDQRLARQDVRGSQAWAAALRRAGLLTGDEESQMHAGLEAIDQEFASASFLFKESDEDIHTAVERRLGELIGPLAGKLHTGRSRNDQVATDLRRWVLDHLPLLQAQIQHLQTTLIQNAERDAGVILPGYTHLQRAQPILLSHWWMSYFWPLQRDRQRLQELEDRTGILPLGSGALAGTGFAIDREWLADELGFRQPSSNSLDAVSDRDFAAEFLFCSAILGVHLSKLSEVVVLFSSAEFGFFELSDEYATGSSLMPQKKNADVFELARGKAGALQGALSGVLATLKGLPSAYDKDLQEDKLPVFTAFDSLNGLLPVIAGALTTLKIHPGRMRSCIDAGMLATDLADYLVLRGVPFREAHALVGQAVQRSLQLGIPLDQLKLDELQAIHPAFESDVKNVFVPEESVARRSVRGGTAPQAVSAQILEAKALIEEENLNLSKS